VVVYCSRCLKDLSAVLACRGRHRVVTGYVGNLRSCSFCATVKALIFFRVVITFRSCFLSNVQHSCGHVPHSPSLSIEDDKLVTNIQHVHQEKGFGPRETQVSLGNFPTPKEYLTLQASLDVFIKVTILHSSLGREFHEFGNPQGSRVGYTG
jgi:hypothetical protein